MFVSAFSPKVANEPVGDVPRYVRASSEVRARFARAGAATRLADVFETGGLRLKVPASPYGCDAVLINTAGGMTGGDKSLLALDINAGARVRITTQSAEKIYRAETTPATVTADVVLGGGASLAWIPQETIIFDGARLSRTLTVQMAENARLTVLEMTVLGRYARNERLSGGLFRDRWRISRAGSLIFADDVRLAGSISETMRKSATGDGAAAFATLLHVAPRAEDRLPALRSAFARNVSNCGVSAWNGMLVARFTAKNPSDVRADVTKALRRILNSELPRIWAA